MDTVIQSDTIASRGGAGAPTIWAAHHHMPTQVTEMMTMMMAAIIGPDPDAIRFGLVSPPPKGVDYAVRESDVYFTKQGQHKLRKQRQRRQNRQGSSTESVPDERNIYDYGPYSSGDGGGGDPLSGRQRPYSEYEELRGSEVAGGGVLMATSKHRSRNPNSLVGLLDGDMSSNTLERNDDEYSGAGLEIAPTYGNRSTNRPRVGSAVLSWFKGKRDSLFSKGYEEPSIEPRGFEVMRRGPIRTHRGAPRRRRLHRRRRPRGH